MLKTAQAIFFMTACFGLMFTLLLPALFAEVAKPVAAVVDGQSIWVTDSGDHRLVKLRASDGTLLGSYPIPSPLRLIYDGQNVWTVSNAGVVTKVQAKDGVILGSYPAGGPAAGIAFDGENVWVSNPESDKVTKIRASDGSVHRRFLQSRQISGRTALRRTIHLGGQLRHQHRD